jgi:hypothetical protein
MPQLTWNELDLLDYLEVSPIVDEDSASHSYELVKHDLRLLLTVWQYESVVQLSIFRSENHAPMFSFACFVRDKVRYVNDKRGKFLELIDCVIAPNRFWYLQAGDVFDHNRFPHGLTIQVEAIPEIKVLFEPCRSI